nr:nonstructural protein 2 [Bird parvovirus]
MLLAAQSLERCRQETNPFLPQNYPLGPPRNLMFLPDPCLTQEKELATATQEHQAAVQASQRSNAPTPAAQAAAPAPILSETFDSAAAYDPMVPETEYHPHSPALSNTWSPDTILEIMDMLAEQMEIENPQIQEQLGMIFDDLQNLTQWDCWGKPKHKKRKPYFLIPKNDDWVGRWVP